VFCNTSLLEEKVESSLSKWSRLKLLAALVVAAMFAGCATQPGTQGGPGLQFDQYEQKWLLNGEPFTPGGLNLATVLASSLRGQGGSVAWFRGTFSKTGTDPGIELRVKFGGAGAGQLFPQSASDSTGTALTVRQVEHTVTRTTFGVTSLAPEEIIAITMPRQFLDSRRSTGLDIQVRGVSGKVEIIKVAADAVSKYLSDFDAAVANRRQ
jgi:hypothetical protein